LLNFSQKSFQNCSSNENLIDEVTGFLGRMLQGGGLLHGIIRNRESKYQSLISFTMDVGEII
jgi:hypothetical protein